jgi:hypothetical protein
VVGPCCACPIYTAPVWIINPVPLLLRPQPAPAARLRLQPPNMWVTPAMWAISYIVVTVIPPSPTAPPSDAPVTNTAPAGRGHYHRTHLPTRLFNEPRQSRLHSASPLYSSAALGILQIGSVLAVPGLIISALPPRLHHPS